MVVAAAVAVRPSLEQGERILALCNFDLSFEELPAGNFDLFFSGRQSIWPPALVRMDQMSPGPWALAGVAHVVSEEVANLILLVVVGLRESCVARRFVEDILPDSFEEAVPFAVFLIKMVFWLVEAVAADYEKLEDVLEDALGGVLVDDAC